MRQRPIVWQRLSGSRDHPCLCQVRNLFSFYVLLLLLCLSSPGEETNAPAVLPLGQVEERNSTETLQVLRHIDEQLRANWLTLEQNSKEAREASARSAEMLSNEWQTFQTAFSIQQGVIAARELEAMKSSRRITVAVGVVALIACLTMFVFAYFQWRMSKTWAVLLTGQPVARGPQRRSLPTVKSGEPGDCSPDTLEASNQSLPGVIDQLERRIEGLEHGSVAWLKAHEPNGTAGDNGGSPGSAARTPSKGDSDRTGSGENDWISTLLAQGEAMLRANELEQAIKCFDEVLRSQPNHAKALVKKGVALERLKKLNEAFACYDQAIAADGSLTIAYLHKGGLCNRLERFKEALDCYERALQTHHA